MSARILSARILSLAVVTTLFSSAVLADTTPTQVGVVKEDSYVLSGPDRSKFYATTSLPKGSRVTIVGGKPGWYYVAPPDGSFCCVAKGYVQRVDNSAIGRVVQPDIRIRAGSSLNDLMSTVLPVRLKEGDTVQIIGESGEWFKIVPPAGSCLYIEQSVVELRSTEPATEVKPVEQTPTTQPVVANVETPTTKPAEVAVVPTTKPSEPTAQAKFDELESQFVEASKLPLDQQPIDSLSAKYTRLTTDSTIDESLSKVAQMRVSTLKLRADARDEYAAATKLQADASARRQALKAEQQELADKAKAAEVSSYAAVGTLRVSSLQPGGVTLYRLTDPSTGRTLLYVRGNNKVPGLMNQFVGVRGDVQSDEALSIRTITPTDIEAVDVAKVGVSVTAGIVPPSITAKAATASLPPN